jgi:hypothetical protein
MKTIHLKPITESTEDYESIEKKILALLKREIYLPIVRELSYPIHATLTNSLDDVLGALRSGRIVYGDGIFLGKFNGSISRELRRMGAHWDTRMNGWRLSEDNFSPELREAIAMGNGRFSSKLEKVAKFLDKVDPEKIAEKLEITDDFNRNLSRLDREFQETVQRLTIAPRLSKEQRQKISEQWQSNMKLWVKGFAEKEIVKLRSEIKSSTFAGNRFESAQKHIEYSFQVSSNKAKFLARQETSLLLSKYTEARYIESGIEEFTWKCVHGTSAHPVRPEHKKCDGRRFRFDSPYEIDDHGRRKPGGVTKPGNNLNPGEDFNCRCKAHPVVRF